MTFYALVLNIFFSLGIFIGYKQSNYTEDKIKIDTALANIQEVNTKKKQMFELFFHQIKSFI